jgi:flagellar hook-associated protein 1 FlgK
MPDLFRVLTTGATSLAAQTAAAATAAHNLQNANTPGYARQRVTIEATLPAEQALGQYVGRGALLGQVTQARDRFLEAQLPAAFGNASGSAARAGALAAVQVLDPQARGGIADALAGFYASLTELSQNPSDPGLRRAAVGAARTLALSFQQTRASLEDTRTGVDRRVAADVSEANGLAAQVAELNRQIRAARAGGLGEPNDLLDARQKAVDRLAELTGAVPVPTSEGDVSLFVAGGGALVTSLHAGTLTAIPDGAQGGHMGLQLTAGGITTSLSPGGELGGLLEASNGALRSAVDALDGLAWDVAGQVNAVHQGGVDLNGDPGVALFTVTAQAGAAGEIAVADAVVADPDLLATRQGTGGPGDASNVLALLGTQSATLPASGLDAGATLSGIIGAFGTAARSAEATADADEALKGHLVTMRDSVSGVSTDEELIELEKAQKAYEAIARVITVTNAMFDTLLQIK